MAVEIGGSIAFSFLEAVLGKLASDETIEYFKTKLNDKMLYKLKNALFSINAVVDDAEQRQIQNFRVKNWLHSVQDVVFDAEDVLERGLNFITYDANWKLNHSTSKVLNLFNTSLSSFDKKIGENVQEILQKLSLLLTQKDILHLNSNPIERSINKSPSTFLPREPFIYGRDVDISRIFNWLKRVTKDKLSMFSLVGMGYRQDCSCAKFIQ
jgi:hypothetical protein